MERAWLCWLNFLKRLAECKDRKAVEAAALLARLKPPVAPGEAPEAPVDAAVAPVEAPPSRQQYNKLLGEIEILRELYAEAEKNFKPYDELAQAKNWLAPVEAAMAVANADAAVGEGGESSDNDASTASDSSESDDEPS